MFVYWIVCILDRLSKSLYSHLTLEWVSIPFFMWMKEGEDMQEEKDSQGLLAKC